MVTSVGHHGEPSEHVSNYVDYYTSILSHVLLVSCKYGNELEMQDFLLIFGYISYDRTDN